VDRLRQRLYRQVAGARGIAEDVGDAVLVFWLKSIVLSGKNYPKDR
jgi:hypothetical protein